MSWSGSVKKKLNVFRKSKECRILVNMTMKKIIYNIFSILSMTVVLTMGTSCEEEKPIEAAPVFPELVTNHDVEPGSELTLTIQPNAAWSISIPKESYAWFKIKDGKFDKQTLTGVSMTEPMTVTIWTTDEESFALRSCDVTMTIGSESKVIASYTLRTMAKAVEAYRAVVNENGSFERTEEGFAYESTAMTSEDVAELVWDDADKRFYFPMKIQANYEWTVEWPSWARADINVDSKVGPTYFEIYAISSKLPMDDMTGEVAIKDGEEVLKTFKVKVPGCKDIFSYTLGGYTSLTFDHAQYFHSGEGSFTKDPVQGIIYGPSAARVVVLEKTSEGYVVPQSPWLAVEVSAWDNVEGADVLQTRNVTISAPRYAGNTDREAVMLFLPATAPADVAELLSSDKSGVKTEYLSYAVNVIQTACPDEYFTFEATADQLESSGLYFERSQSPILPEKNFVYAEGTSGWQYNLSYLKEMAVTKSAFYITYPYETISIYDAEGNEIRDEDLSEHWLAYNPLGDGLYGQILMDMTKFTTAAPSEIDGYVVFKDETGKVLAAVHCFYKEEEKTPVDVLEDVSEEMFVNPSAAAAAGATIYELVSGPTYEIYKEHQAPIYVVRCTSENKPFDIKTSKQCWMYSCAGKQNGPEIVTIDDQIYYDTEYYKLVDDYNNGTLTTYPNPDNDRSTMGILTFGKTSFESRVYPGTSTFKMHKPAGVTENTMSETILFGSSSSVLFVFICELILP